MDLRRIGQPSSSSEKLEGPAGGPRLSNTVRSFFLELRRLKGMNVETEGWLRLDALEISFRVRRSEQRGT